MWLVDSEERFVMRKTVLCALAFLCVFFVSSFQEAVSGAGDEPIRLMRRPDINNGRIVFAWAGDLWMVPEEGGQARRLTIRAGAEDYPKFSPDGDRIAFSGDLNERSNAICAMSANGAGEPEVLTYHAAGGYPTCWTRDGKNILFATAQESFVRFFTQLFRVPAGGGLPVDLGIGKASFACYSPDGSKIAFNRHPDLFWWWKRYKGSMNQDVWIYDFKTGAYEQITTWEGNDAWPMWTGNRIYFASDREGDVNNIFYYDLGTKQVTQVTRFEKHGVTWPSMSSDGTKIVFERDARLYVLDTATRESREVVVYAPIDSRDNMISYINPGKYINSFDVSPTAKRIIFEARGDLYTMPAEHGDVRNLTESSGARDVSPSWSPDGKWVAYVSDKNGDGEVYLVDQMGKEPEKKLTSNGHFKTGIAWSPKSDKMVYTTEENALYLLDKDGHDPKLVAKNEHRDISSYSWSPDGAWIAYDFAARNRNRDIFIYDVKSGENHQITTDLGDDTEPVFTPDGKYLLLITSRVGTSRVLARLSLLPEDKAPFEFKDDEETGVASEDTTGGSGGNDDEENAAQDESDKGKGNRDKAKKDKAAAAKKKKVEVKIDFTNIEGRIRRIPKVGGLGLHNIQATEKYYYYLVQGQRMFLFRPSYDLYMFNVEKIKSEKVASSIGTYGIAASREKLVTFDGTDFNIIKVGSKAAAAKKSDSDSEDEKEKYDFARHTRMRLDRAAEWNQIFNEAWRVEKYLFYDPKLHGVNWDEVRDYYGKLIPYVQTREELNTLLTEMVGELNASHQRVSEGDVPEIPRASQGFLGAKVVLDEKTGYPRIEKVYSGDKASLTDKSPLDNDYIKAKEGDYLLAIDGHELKPGEDFNKYLVDKTSNKITIKTNSRPELKGATETTFQPIYSDAKLQYDNWAMANAKYVDEKSGGRIGYMHLPDMMGPGWTEFREKFDKLRYRDAIIIDVRYNGGGNIDERIIDYLERRPYQITKARNESPEPRPSDGFYGQLAVLINEYSFSDAEVFPAAFKTRGLGTIIGVPTLGYVLAVVPHTLIDGGQVRKAFIGIWDIKTGTQLEGHGVEPDILVPSPPEMEKAGRDVQLEKAVEVLMEKIAANPNKFDELPIEKR
jgi:tricorn protease